MLNNIQQLDEKMARLAIQASGLSKRYERVFALRLSGHTLQQIADDLGVTRERIRQMEAKICFVFNSHRNVH